MACSRSRVGIGRARDRHILLAVGGHRLAWTEPCLLVISDSPSRKRWTPRRDRPYPDFDILDSGSLSRGIPPHWYRHRRPPRRIYIRPQPVWTDDSPQP